MLLKKFILYYLYTILLVPILERVVFGSLDKVTFHPGIIIHVTVLGLLVFNFFKTKFKKYIISYMIIGFFIVYIMNFFIIEQIQFSNISSSSSISYTLKIFLLLFISDYIYKNKNFFLQKLDTILLINAIVILANIIIGYTFKIGWQSYSIEGIDNSFRGFLAGNDTSIFAFTSFGYSLFSFFKYKSKSKKIVYLLLIILSIYSMYIIATKAMFVAMIILFLFSIRNGFKIRTLILGITIISIAIISFLSVPAVQERILKNYLIQKKQTAERLNVDAVPESLKWLNEIAPGRTVIGLTLVMQMIKNDPLNLILGYGVSGIYEAFGRPPMMHLFSPIGHYGLLGWLIFYLPQLLLAIKIIKKRKITMITTLYLAIFLYGTLGGFVYGNAATSVIYALLFAISLFTIKYKKGVLL